MASGNLTAAAAGGTCNRFRLSRRGRKLQSMDAQSVLAALPKDVPERTWAEILHREELDQALLELREELFEAAMEECYHRYMERQATSFTAHCTAKAWLQLIDWHFFRHDPGEESSAYPPCYIPQREESWTADAPPEPSPKDPWSRAELTVGELLDLRPSLQRWPSSSSLTLPTVPEIPSSCWFPGKVQLQVEEIADEDFSYMSMTSPPPADSEVLQRVTDYSNAEQVPSSMAADIEQSTVEGGGESSLRGGGDSLPAIVSGRRSKSHSKVCSRDALRQSRSSVDSQQTLVSDCQLRSLRLNTRHEIAVEKVDTPPRTGSFPKKP